MNQYPPRYVVVTSYYKSPRFVPKYTLAARWVSLRLPRVMRGFLRFIFVANDPSPRELSLLQWALRGLPVELIVAERETLYASWNRAIRATPSALAYTFWNMDDVRLPGGLAEQFRLCELQDEPRMAVAPYSKFIFRTWRHGIELGLNFRRPGERFLEQFSPSPFFCVNRKAFETLGLFCEAFRISGDREWYARFAERGYQPNVAHRATGIFFNYGGSLSTSGGMRSRLAAEHFRIEELHPGYKVLRSLAEFETLRRETKDIVFPLLEPSDL